LSLIPSPSLSLLAAERQAYFRTFVLASVAGVYSLFPLLFTPAESIVQLIYSVVWAIFVFAPLLRRIYEFPKSMPYVILDGLEKLYLAGFVFLHLFVTFFPQLAMRQQQPILVAESCVSTGYFTCPEPEGLPIPSGISGMEFLPLMATSVYCAVGLVWAFLRLGFIYLKQE